MPQYRVILEEGNNHESVTAWEGEAEDMGHAVDLAHEANEGHIVVDVDYIEDDLEEDN